MFSMPGPPRRASPPVTPVQSVHLQSRWAISSSSTGAALAQSCPSLMDGLRIEPVVAWAPPPPMCESSLLARAVTSAARPRSRDLAPQPASPAITAQPERWTRWRSPRLQAGLATACSSPQELHNNVYPPVSRHGGRQQEQQQRCSATATSYLPDVAQLSGRPSRSLSEPRSRHGRRSWIAAPPPFTAFVPLQECVADLPERSASSSCVHGRKAMSLCATASYHTPRLASSLAPPAEMRSTLTTPQTAKPCAASPEIVPGAPPVTPSLAACAMSYPLKSPFEAELLTVPIAAMGASPAEVRRCLRGGLGSFTAATSAAPMQMLQAQPGAQLHTPRIDTRPALATPSLDACRMQQPLKSPFEAEMLTSSVSSTTCVPPLGVAHSGVGQPQQSTSPPGGQSNVAASASPRGVLMLSCGSTLPPTPQTPNVAALQQGTARNAATQPLQQVAKHVQAGPVFDVPRDARPVDTPQGTVPRGRTTNRDRAGSSGQGSLSPPKTPPAPVRDTVNYAWAQWGLVPNKAADAVAGSRPADKDGGDADEGDTKPRRRVEPIARGRIPTGGPVRHRRASRSGRRSSKCNRACSSACLGDDGDDDADVQRFFES